jgi:hypothetical protein
MRKGTLSLQSRKRGVCRCAQEPGREIERVVTKTDLVGLWSTRLKARLNVQSMN